MEQALNTAKNILTNLNYIQPMVSVSGLEVESRKIKEMKNDIATLMCSLTPSKVVMDRMVQSRREDVLSLASEFMAVFTDDRDSAAGLTDNQIHKAILTAESYSKCARGYLANKEQVRKIYGGQNAS